MTGLQTLEARLILGVIAGVLGVILSSLPALHRPPDHVFRRWMTSAFLLSRFGIFAFLFLGFHVRPRGDIPAFYFPEANAVLHHMLPYRDFGSSYAPLHPYLDAAVLLLWHSPLALILFATAVESLLFFLWLRLGGSIFPERDLRVAAMLYLTSALSLQFVTVDGQDNVLIALLVLTALWLAARSRATLSGLVLGTGVLAVKLIPIFYAPVFFVSLRRRWRWTGGFAAVVVFGYGAFAALRLPILQPLAIEGPLKSSGTIPFLIETFTGFDLPVGFWTTGMLLLLGALYLAVLRRSSVGASPTALLSVLWGVTAATLILVTFANKSWAPYLLLCLFPLCIAVASRGLWSRVALAAFGVVALVEKSYWATLLNLEGAQQVRAGLLGRNPTYLWFLPIEILLLLGYGWLLGLSLSRLRSSGIPSPPLGSALSGFAFREVAPGESKGASSLTSGKVPR